MAMYLDQLFHMQLSFAEFGDNLVFIYVRSCCICWNTRTCSRSHIFICLTLSRDLPRHMMFTFLILFRIMLVNSNLPRYRHPRNLPEEQQGCQFVALSMLTSTSTTAASTNWMKLRTTIQVSFSCPLRMHFFIIADLRMTLQMQNCNVQLQLGRTKSKSEDHNHWKLLKGFAAWKSFMISTLPHQDGFMVTMIWVAHLDRFPSE